MSRVNRYYFGTDFTANKNYESCVREFNQIFEQICQIWLWTRSNEVYQINIHEPAENRNEVDKDEFYEEVSRINDSLLGSEIIIMLVDTSTKIWKKPMLVQSIGLGISMKRVTKMVSNI